jgi:hypothetical protein
MDINNKDQIIDRIQRFGAGSYLRASYELKLDPDVIVEAI